MRMTIADTMTIHLGTLNEDYTYRMPTWYLRGMYVSPVLCASHAPPVHAPLLSPPRPCVLIWSPRRVNIRSFFGKSFMDIVGEMPLECPQTGVKAVINFKAKVRAP